MATEKKLSLTTRKNMRDNEEKKKEHIGKLETITGKTGITFVFKDEIAVAEQLEKNGYKDRIGEIFYDNYLKKLEESFGKLCASEEAKVSLNASWTTTTILFELDEKSENYQQILFTNGDLRISCKAGNIWTNIDRLGGDVPDRLMSPYAGVSLPLKSANNLRDFDAKKDANLASIATATGKSGLEFSFTNLKAVDEQLKKNNYAHRTGEIFFQSYLHQLSESFTKLCADEHAKSALQRKWTTNKIFYETDAKAEGYQQITFPNGDLRMSSKPENIWTNISRLGEDVTAQLTSDAAGVTLSLKSAKNIRDYEEKAAGHLANIGTAIGRGGPVTFVVEDVKAVDAATIKNGYANRLGEIIWGAYLENLSNQLTKLCKDDMVKEAIAASFSKNLIFRLDPKCSGYQNCKFDGGNLVMFCKPDNIWTNISTLGGDIEKQL